jgi:redox-sensitive bicupin YhaK (pirin superfamily)
MDLLVDRILKPEPRSAHSAIHFSRLVVSPDDFAVTAPFLLVGEDWVAPPASLRHHSRRGLDTLTFVVEGGLEHRDPAGAQGLLSEGDVQWIVSGRAPIDVEVPVAPGAHTLQVWLHLAHREPAEAGAYRDQRKADAPLKSGDGFQVRVYAGRIDGVGRSEGRMAPLELFDLRVEPGHEAPAEFFPGYRGFMYVLDGSGRLLPEDVALKEEDVVWFKPVPRAGDAGRFSIHADTPMRALLFAAPVAESPAGGRDPLVMDTVDEIRKAYDDARHGGLADMPLRTSA